jgi:ADP-ribosylglycohydrolase/protein-tyrosine phosphatase
MMASMSTLPPEASQAPARPLPGSYWVEPHRLLVGEFPGSRSRADTMDRLRLVLAAGITQFIDLTEASELPSYEELLPFSTPTGRRVQYIRESIPDHSVPASPETMERILATLRTALDAGETVYVHCRAGIGRSAMVAGCYLVDRGLDATAALETLQQCWKQSAKSPQWVYVPETDEQFEYIRDWARRKGAAPHPSQRRHHPSALASRIRGALFGLAIGDIRGATQAGANGDDWTQHTALAVCVAESLLAQRQLDAKDQMERFLKWKREVQRKGEGGHGLVDDDVSRALATYRWRGLATAGSHDPGDRSGGSLSRVLPAVLFACHDPAAAVALAAECSRTTHQGPVILDACRYLAAMLVGALNGGGVAVALERYEPIDGLWAQRPLKREVEAVATAVPLMDAAERPEGSDVLRTLANARRVLMLSSDFETIVGEATRASPAPALDGAVCGALAGAVFGSSAIPAAMLATVPRVDILERLAGQFAALHAGSTVATSRAH